MNKHYTSKFFTAKQMALTSRNLSQDSNAATLATGEVYRWSDRFQVWAGPFPQTQDDAQAPRIAS